MIKTQPTYEVTNYESLNKFLMGTLPSIRKKEMAVEEANAISQIADKIVKNNLCAIMDKKRRGDDSPLAFFEPSEKQVLIG